MVLNKHNRRVYMIIIILRLIEHFVAKQCLALFHLTLSLTILKL